ncbi:GNAT family N-acetyltransferase [Undibacterium sp. Jales W-56]|uniref:GNAT family N-acetyltransferase n=1 Tax=Undibacterium sp. Jales W-56 TaxID=2897325 RepID=UPI0021D275AA|nr:GNAT family N-acetyltransferase [Undibacterium sp. Jales W-56]MCU6434323.1 GNAT family N-acetyltransferase [Undibacterium sp. Jales W-56]
MTLPPHIRADALWLLAAKARGGAHWLSNVDCRIECVSIADSTQPVSLLDASHRHTSYVASPRSAWLRYAQDEVIRHAPLHTQSLSGIGSTLVLSPLAAMISACGIDRAAIVGNHLMSTNLYPDWQANDIKDLTGNLRELYPDRPFMMRNICPAITPQLSSALQGQAWKLIPARMIYTCDPADDSVWKHNHIKKDARLLADPSIQIIPPEQVRTSDLARMRALFRQLFIEKHSRLNPDFTPAFFELCLETGFLDLYGLRWQERLVGVIGIYQHPEAGWLTTPLIGYDTSLPQELGIYRRLMALLLQQARERQAKLHYSSGASQFKRARGGQAHLEYTAVFTGHLPKYRQLALQVFAKTLQKLAPAILSKADQR